jgi:hypothetical protein
MAMYCLNMLDMALEICQTDSSFEDVATKFFEHFIYIAESLNQIGEDWTGSWDEDEGFFYDILALPDGQYIPIKVRSLVGLSTLFATLVLDKERLANVPEFKRRLKWFRNYRIQNKFYVVIEELKPDDDILLSLIPGNGWRNCYTPCSMKRSSSLPAEYGPYPRSMKPLLLPKLTDEPSA